MDYHRIYREFIADRKGKPEPTGYVERHHILPRCMGGRDCVDNLVALTAEDHFFAHLLLAKAHENARMWGAVRMMTGHSQNLSRVEIRALPKADAINGRWRYGWARRCANDRMRGLGHPMADQSVHIFKHEDGREYQGTRTAFAQAHDVPAASVNNIINGIGLSAYGWYLPLLNPEGRVGMDPEAQMDMERRRYRHFDGREVEANRREMAQIAGVTAGNVGMLITGRIRLCGGWQIIDGRPLVTEDHLRRDGEFNARFDGTEYTFIHDDGRTLIASMSEAARMYGNRGKWTQVAQGIKTYKGWRLAGTNHKRSTKGKPRRFINRDGREFVGTQTEFAKMAGLTVGPVHAVVHRGSITLCGWMFEGTLDRSHLHRRDGTGAVKVATAFTLQRGLARIVGDRTAIAQALGTTKAKVSSAICAIKAGKMRTYKGWSVIDADSATSHQRQD